MAELELNGLLHGFGELPAFGQLGAHVGKAKAQLQVFLLATTFLGAAGGFIDRLGNIRQRNLNEQFANVVQHAASERRFAVLLHLFGD